MTVRNLRRYEDRACSAEPNARHASTALLHLEVLRYVEHTSTLQLVAFEYLSYGEHLRFDHLAAG